MLNPTPNVAPTAKRRVRQHPPWPLLMLAMVGAALFAVPLVLAIAAAISTGALAILASLLAVAAAAAGVFTERWLFFAEAQHVSTLFYGEKAA